MNIYKYPKIEEWDTLIKRPILDKKELENSVSKILLDVKNNGDNALFKYTKRFDKAELTQLRVSKNEIEIASKKVASDLKDAINLAKLNIEKFHSSQRESIEIIETTIGVKCWRKSVAIEKVGLYIPGGSAPLFSTILMLGIPAKIAGCKEIVLCTPPNIEGKIDPVVLYTANLIGITKIFKTGGAQAIAGMAYGTQTIPKVYKIFGPGNQFVTKAKELIQQDGIAIDMPAGPSEVLIIANKSAIPEFVAADLLSQAEHGEDSQVILLSDDELVIKNAVNAMFEQLEKLPRKEIALKAIKNSRAILFNSINEAVQFSNQYGPEHLILALSDSENYSEKIINAGSVFLGNYSCESAGDYASGTNHTLPTNGYAKNYSGVSLDSFIKKITFQQLSKQGIINIGPAIELMAEAEGLIAHKNAVSIRLKEIYNV